MKPTIKTEVIIIGAGPAELSLACQLVRYGVDFVIVEKNERITPYSKAIGVQARTPTLLKTPQHGIYLGQQGARGGNEK